ncbi:2'-5' RNA ligase family protein [Nocardioides sp. HDW12B]|uniref:2'-5' RNA ligase family protein n=1 Tax=Nocardioides sp. HDW12B TaxID=2714939 RepID=UPI0014085180|nr:2'-5' RNA ligase family protein [Nocardioides sp. HDW12B]QIK65495.1 2'-5' RNA ligase family protein [Nocardioides sp. HDW12B]
MTTIGVSLAVPEPWGPQLQEYRVGLGDTPAAGIPTHITLVPPVEVDEAALGDVVSHLEAAAREHAAFDVHLRGTGTFRPVSPVVFVSLVEGISGCELLAKTVAQGPLARETEFPYHPHVTVAHHLSEALLDRAFDEQAGFECRFTADRFWLYVHHSELGWAPAHEFVLGG